MKGRDKNGENELDLLSVERRKKERKKEKGGLGVKDVALLMA